MKRNLENVWTDDGILGEDTTDARAKKVEEDSRRTEVEAKEPEDESVTKQVIVRKEVVETQTRRNVVVEKSRDESVSTQLHQTQHLEEKLQSEQSLNKSVIVQAPQPIKTYHETSTKNQTEVISVATLHAEEAQTSVARPDLVSHPTLLALTTC